MTEWIIAGGGLALAALLLRGVRQRLRDLPQHDDETQDDFTLSIARQRAMLERRNGK